jgi:hypothetical protein
MREPGYVYILINPNFKEYWVKISITFRPVDVRSYELCKLDTAQQDTEAKMHIIENAFALNNKVNENLQTEEDVIKFATYLIRKCYLVAVLTPSQAS